MGNRVAHPISQATLVQCDALCDAVDEAEALLSRGTSLLHKLPNEYGLVEKLVTTSTASCRDDSADNNCNSSSTNGGSATDGPLAVLARYLASGDPAPPSFPTPLTGATGGPVEDVSGSADATPPPAVASGGAGGSGGDVDHAAARGDGKDDGTRRYSTAVASVEPPPPRIQEYSVRWRLPRQGIADAGGEEEEGVGARLYARVMNDGCWGEAGGGDDGGADEMDAPPVVRLAVSVAEPASASRC
ncbi:unnamed protein product [Ectocarpus sp. 12 AP-2014]